MQANSVWTYVFAYYLKKNNQSVIFEDNQKDLESATETLSEYLERDITSENLAHIGTCRNPQREMKDLPVLILFPSLTLSPNLFRRRSEVSHSAPYPLGNDELPEGSWKLIEIPKAMADPERIGDAAEDLEEMEEEEEPTKVAITEEMLQRPEVLAALQGTLHREMMEALPAAVKRRIKALKKLQLESTHIEAKFYEEVHLLECKYHKLYSPLYEKRGEVISGLYEPTDAECEWESDDEKIDEVSDALKKKVKIEGADSEGDKNDVNKNEDIKGIPDFWLTIFKNVQLLSEMVQEHDEPILKHLIDIKVIFLESSPMGFVLEFHFSQNEYFSNSVLTKEYEMKCKPDESDPFSFEGPEIFKCKGCVIDWKKGKNVTVKTIKKKQKHKSRGAVRTVTKTIQNDSFFNFFSPPSVPDDQDADIDEETRALLTTDFEIGHYIRERIVPRAVLYYTGEALEDEDFEEEEEGEEGEEEEDDDDDPTYKPGNRISVRSGNNPTPSDCKQQ